MLCDICQKREAKIYYTEIINGEKKEQHLCEECASEHTSFSMKQPLNKEVTLGELICGLLGGAGIKEEKKSEIVCPICGMNYEEFLKGGHFGCAGCYQSFGIGLDKVMKNIHGASRHSGKWLKGYKPVNKKEEKIKELPELERLSLQLQQAIEKEEFEEAAKLRDIIRELKQKEALEAVSEQKEETAEKKAIKETINEEVQSE